LKVRSTSLADYPEVRAVWVAAGLEIRPGDRLREVKLKLARDNGLFLVAEEDDRIVGSVLGAWDGRRGWIYHLSVLPSFKRRGVATGLIRELEARMRKLGVPKLNALIYPWNEESLRFFERLGYGIQTMSQAEKWLTTGRKRRVRNPRPQS
jgi:ribosomal protein S18 acetylase RimI-like enzyme